MSWPWRRRRQRGPSPEAQAAQRDAEQAKRRSQGLLEEMLTAVAELRDHRAANDFDQLLSQAYQPRRRR